MYKQINLGSSYHLWRQLDTCTTDIYMQTDESHPWSLYLPVVLFEVKHPGEQKAATYPISVFHNLNKLHREDGTMC